jgi:hypothetical protein
MLSNQMSAFEYVSILVSIILGLGITQLLSAFTDLLYNYKKVKFYLPHTIWIVFLLFLHIQDWFITYQLKDNAVWYLPELLFILLYPISLFIIAKLILPTNHLEESVSMKTFYFTQYPIIFLMMSFAVIISVALNMYLLKKNITQELPIFIFLITLLSITGFKIKKPIVHLGLAVLILVGTLLSVILEHDQWIIK